MIDDKFVEQAAGQGTAVEENFQADTVPGRNVPDNTVSTAHGDMFAAGQPVNKRSGHKKENGVFRTAGSVAAAVLLMAGVLAGIILASKSRNRSPASPGQSGDAIIKSSEATSATPIRLPADCTEYSVVEIIDRIYFESDGPAAPSSYGSNPTQAPGAKTDPVYLRQASQKIAGEKIAIRFGKYDSSLGYGFTPVYSLHRDIKDGKMLDSGSIVLMLSRELPDDAKFDGGKIASVLIEGHVDDVKNAVIVEEYSRNVLAGPLVVSGVRIIDFFDGMYPFNSLYPLAFGKKALSLIDIPMYVYYGGLYNGDYGKTVVNTFDCSADFAGLIFHLSLGSSDSAWANLCFDASIFNTEAFKDTYRRFGLSYFEGDRVGEAYSGTIKNPSSSFDRLKAYLYGYPAFSSFENYLRAGTSFEYVGIERSKDTVVYTFLFRFNDDIVSVTTPELRNSFYESDGYYDLVYDVSIGGSIYTVASPGNASSDHPILSDLYRARQADEEPFTVRKLSYEEYEVLIRNAENSPKFDEFLSSGDYYTKEQRARLVPEEKKDENMTPHP